MAETNDLVTWTEQDFENISWHDCHIHTIRVRNSKEGYDYDLVLNIDYILEWIHPQQGSSNFVFVVAPAMLTFKNVDKLVIDVALAFKEDLVIDRIQREEITTHSTLGLHTAQWTIHLHSLADRHNQIGFQSDGFVMALTDLPKTIDSQCLEEHERP